VVFAKCVPRHPQKLLTTPPLMILNQSIPSVAQCGMVQHKNGFYHGMQLPSKQFGTVALLPRHLSPQSPPSHPYIAVGSRTFELDRWPHCIADLITDWWKSYISFDPLIESELCGLQCWEFKNFDLKLRPKTQDRLRPRTMDR
jgi:hypothetical protein